ncbi:LysM peptidoglycan-binding domain-containing protein [Acidimangrovimonas sediminis]|uniref:LysM peptidoglycan-binding domain-containing protein n=1 Tax=Acidimangrovimonas sediminis TaxID=2056283 RepID=UPI000C7F85BF|nr:LysM peptidoglycan-binding domain-containing protein [Acidimangrovimonas sediminis]
MPTSPGAPSFDVVRVSPDGQALVAGRASPGAKIEIEIAGKGVASTAADGEGRFVSMFDLPRADAPRLMRLHATGADGKRVASSDDVILAPTPAAPAAPGMGQGADAGPGAELATTDAAPLPPGGASGAAGRVPGAASAPGGEGIAPTAMAPGPQARPTSGPAVAAADGQAPAVLLAGKDGVRVLQGGAASAPRPKGEVAIDAISYGAKGEVQLSGQGREGEAVRLYLDNREVATAPVGPGGSWAVTVPGVGQGLYTLRADQIDAAGKVVSRFETPFKREAPELVAAAPGQGEPAVAGVGTTAGVSAAIITVQPGYTLWGIAKRNYGDGLMYVKVFAANKGQIRDPNLIYPGQVFSVPAAN